MSGPRIRRAKEADLPSILGLYDELFRLQKPWRMFKPRAGVRPEMEARYTAALADPDARLLVAVDGDTVVGMALGQVHRPSRSSDELGVELSSFIVRASHQRRGVGTALARAIGRFAQERGVEKVTLGTFAQNEAALRFWTNLGFTPGIIQMSAASDGL